MERVRRQALYERYRQTALRDDIRARRFCVGVALLGLAGGVALAWRVASAALSTLSLMAAVGWCAAFVALAVCI